MMGNARYFACLGLAIFGTAACTSQADLGNSGSGGMPVSTQATVYATGAPSFGSGGSTANGLAVPFKLVENIVRFDRFGLKGEMLIWWDKKDYQHSLQNYQHSCALQNCASTLDSKQVTNLPGPFPQNESTDAWLENYVDYEPAGPTSMDFTNLVLDQKQAYFLWDNDWVRHCNVGNCDTTLERIPLRPPSGTSISGGLRGLAGVDSTFVYAGFSDASASPLSSIVRVRRDGPYTNEAGAYVEYEVTVSAQRMFTAHLHGEDLYWVGSDGQVHSCPKSGCTGEPMNHPAAIEWVSEFAFDNEFMYLLEGVSGDAKGKIIRCGIPGCSQPVTLVDGDVSYWAQMLVHGSYVYFSTWDSFNGTVSISVVPK